MTSRNLDTVRKEYVDKYFVYLQMVGWLYKSILYDELFQLKEEYKKLGGDVVNLPNYGIIQ